jgi:hypothetical protein
MPAPTGVTLSARNIFTSDTKISGREKFLTTPINFGTLNFYEAALSIFFFCQHGYLARKRFLVQRIF